MQRAAHAHPGRDTPQSPQVRRLVAETSDRLAQRHDEVAQAMSDLLANIDWLDVDPHMRQFLEASVAANVATIFHMFSNGIAIEELQPTTAAVAYAARLAQRGIPANSLVRAYHMGQDDLLGAFFEEVERLPCDAVLKFHVMQDISSRLYRYIDWITMYVLDAYEAEKQRWETTSGNVYASLVHKLLADREPIEPDAFGAETGYLLDQYHLGVIVWTDTARTGPDDLRQIELFVDHLCRRSGARNRPIFMAIDRSTAWAWVPLGRRDVAVHVADLARRAVEAPGLRVAVGLSAHGASGFRRTHQQAEAARDVALSSADAPQVLGYGDQGVAIVSALAGDLQATRVWVREVLGPLAGTDANTARLRDTLRIFLSTGSSHTETAELLHLHRNSVRYRINRALQERGRPLEHDRLDVELALQVCHFLGDAVLVG